jgi:hypothetical protein
MMYKFESWFFEGEEFSIRAERFFDSLEAMSSTAAKEANLVLWLKAAFEAGYTAGFVAGENAEKSDALRESIVAGGEIHSGDGGYGIGTRENYEAFAKRRNYHLGEPNNPMEQK